MQWQLLSVRGFEANSTFILNLSNISFFFSVCVAYVLVCFIFFSLAREKNVEILLLSLQICFYILFSKSLILLSLNFALLNIISLISFDILSTSFLSLCIGKSISIKRLPRVDRVACTNVFTSICC